VSDIFREVEEEVRRERYEKLWKQYGDYVIAAAAVLIIGVAGYKLWQHYEFVETQKASAAYLQAMEVSSAKPIEAAALYAKLAQKAPSGYAATAELAEAGDLNAAGKKAEALALYRRIIAKHDDEVGEIARLRAAWLTADSAKKSDLEELLQPVNGDKSGWRFMAREILAYADFRDGRLDASRAAFAKLAADTAAPDTIRMRAKAMASLLHTGVGNYGTVPPPETEKPETAADAQQGNAKK
jgi:hypothetical protein